MIVGVDEAGRGPLAGCVVSCALYIKEAVDVPIRDSKSLCQSHREKLFRLFRDKTVFAVGIATNTEIDTYNILGATFLSFHRAIGSLLEKEPKLTDATFIIDGNRFRAMKGVKHRCVRRADTTIKEVAFASIVAKLFRDHLMEVAHVAFPRWNLRKHKGYPTREHYSLIEKYNTCPLHRRSFLLHKEARAGTSHG